MSFLLGLLICAAAFADFIVGGANTTRLLDAKALLFVVAGTVGAILITSPLQTLLRDLRCITRCLGRAEKPEQTISQIVTLVQTARHGGVLSLEGKESGIENPFIKKGIVLITGSADRETIEDILEEDARDLSSQEKSAQEFVERIAFISPGIGMIATLVEVMQMLYTYKEPQALAAGVAGALLPVVYSGLIAFLILFPLASRVRAGAAGRSRSRELAIQGVLAIQSSEPPYIVEQRLMRFAKGETKQPGKDQQ